VITTYSVKNFDCVETTEEMVGVGLRGAMIPSAGCSPLNIHSQAYRMGQILSGKPPLSIGGANKMMLNSLCANAAPLTSDEVAGK
jgi:hypothetical protein